MTLIFAQALRLGNLDFFQNLYKKRECSEQGFSLFPVGCFFVFVGLPALAGAYRFPFYRGRFI